MAKAKRTNKTAPAQSGGTITDIPHEEVVEKKELNQAAPAKVEEAEVIDEEKALQTTIQKELKRFNIAEAGINALKETYGALTIADVNDKDGYKKVKDAWNEVRSTRTALEKKGLEIRGGYTKITKAVKVEEDRLITLITPLEEDLEKKWKDIDAEKERAKKEKEAAEQKRLMDRLSLLTGKGMAVVDGYYSIGETIAVDVATIRTMTDDQFTTLSNAVEAKATEIAKAKKEKEEADEKERARLKEQQDKLDEQKREQDAAQEKLETAKRDLARAQEEQAKALRDMRMEMFSSVGYSLDSSGNEVVFDNGFKQDRVSVPSIISCKQDEFTTMLRESKERVAIIRKEYEEHLENKKKEEKALEEKRERVHEALTGAGLQFDFKKRVFWFKNDFFNVELSLDKIVEQSEEEIQDHKVNLTAVVSQAKVKQIEMERESEKEREKQRKAQLGDAVNFGEYLEQVAAIEVPDLTTVEYKDKLGQFRDRLNNLVREYMPEQEPVKS